MQQENISTAERSWSNPLNALQEAIHYSFNPLNDELNPILHLLALLGAHHIFHFSGLRVKKFCICCFSLWYEFFVRYGLGVEKEYQRGLDAEPLEFKSLRPTGCLTNQFRNLSLYFRVIGKTPGLISRNNFV